MLLKPSSHMLPMHRSHGHQYCLGYCSDMITEVASNIGHPSLYCRRTVIKSWGPMVSPAYYEHSPQLLSFENRTKKIPSCLILHLHLYLIYIYLATKNLSDNPAAGTPAKLTQVQHQPHMRTRLYKAKGKNVSFTHTFHFWGPPFFSNNLFLEMLEQTKTTSDMPQKGMQEKKENKKIFSKAK